MLMPFQPGPIGGTTITTTIAGTDLTIISTLAGVMAATPTMVATTVAISDMVGIIMAPITVTTTGITRIITATTATITTTTIMAAAATITTLHANGDQEPV